MTVNRVINMTYSCTSKKKEEARFGMKNAIKEGEK